MEFLATAMRRSCSANLRSASQGHSHYQPDLIQHIAAAISALAAQYGVAPERLRVLSCRCRGWRLPTIEDARAGRFFNHVQCPSAGRREAVCAQWCRVAWSPTMPQKGTDSDYQVSSCLVPSPCHGSCQGRRGGPTGAAGPASSAH